jgi:molybdate transport system substrate-binding protein
MKKLLCLLLSLAMVCALAACGGSSAPAAEDAGASAAPPAAASSAAASTTGTQSADAVELTVFAAASMTETLTAIAEQYKSVAPNVTLVFNFDSSGTLKTQIQEGAACDLFLSAGQKQLNQLDSADTTGDNEEHLDFVASDTRRDLLENKVTLCVSPGSDKGIDSFDTLAAALKDGEVLMAMGNSDVPVGQYTQKILAYYELNEEELANAGKITYGTNVKDVVEQVKNESVQVGVVYATDAASGGLTVIDTAKKEMCGQVIYPAAVLKESAHPEEAKAFLEYLQSDAAMKVFEGVGFSKAE